MAAKKPPHPSTSAPPPHPNRKPTSSWADKLRVSHSQNRFNLSSVETTVRDGILAIPDSLVAECCTYWETCLVGNFMGKSMPFHAVQSIALRAWKALGLQDVIYRSEAWFVFRFQSAEQALSVIEKGPWMFGSKNILLRQWNPQQDYSYSSVPVWVRMPGFPLVLWNEAGLSMVSSMIGRPLACDQMTAERTRLSYARVLVELDASRAPPTEVQVQLSIKPEPMTIQVKYEWKPSWCPECCEFGHFCEPDSDTDSDPDQAPEGPPQERDPAKGKTPMASSERGRQAPETERAEPPPLAPDRGHQAPIAEQTVPPAPPARDSGHQALTVARSGAHIPRAQGRGHQAPPQTAALTSSRRRSPQAKRQAASSASTMEVTTLCVLNSQSLSLPGGNRFSPLDADLGEIGQISSEESAHSSYSPPPSPAVERKRNRRKPTRSDFTIS